MPAAAAKRCTCKWFLATACLLCFLLVWSWSTINTSQKQTSAKEESLELLFSTLPMGFQHEIGQIRSTVLNQTSHTNQSNNHPVAIHLPVWGPAKQGPGVKDKAPGTAAQQIPTTSAALMSADGGQPCNPRWQRLESLNCRSLKPYLPSSHQHSLVKHQAAVRCSHIVMVYCSRNLHFLMDTHNGLGVVVHQQFQRHWPAIEEACADTGAEAHGGSAK